MVSVAVAEAVLLSLSVALKVTKVSPSGNVAGASLLGASGPSGISVAVALANQAAIAGSVAGVPVASTAATVVFAGARMTGGRWS